MRKTKTLLLTLALGLAALPALAAKAAEAAPEGGGNSPFAGDIGNAVWTVVIFGLVLVVLGKFAWGPILKALQSRETFIRESLEKAQSDRLEAEARLKEYLDKINASRAEATAIVDEGRKDAEAVKHRIEQDAREEAEKIIARGKHEIELATATAVKELYTTSAKLATELAGRILAREIKPQDHERLIADAIDELSRQQPQHGTADSTGLKSGLN
jgi:F-type H+-transporting ATPase subunit b